MSLRTTAAVAAVVLAVGVSGCGRKQTAAAGASGERMTLFLARGLTKVGPGGGDHTESIRVHEVPLPEVPDWLVWQKQRGVEIDLKVYAGLFFAGQLPK